MTGPALAGVVPAAYRISGLQARWEYTQVVVREKQIRSRVKATRAVLWPGGFN
jgi:hypothetical protein